MFSKAPKDPFASGNQYSPIALHAARVQYYESHPERFELIGRVTSTDVSESIPAQQVFFTYYDRTRNTRIAVFYPTKDDDSGDNVTLKGAIPLKTALRLYKAACKINPLLQADELSIPIHTTQKKRKHWLTLNLSMDNTKSNGEENAMVAANYIDSMLKIMGGSYPTDYIESALTILDPALPSLSKTFTGEQLNDCDCGPYTRFYSQQLAEGTQPSDLPKIKKMSEARKTDKALFEGAKTQNEAPSPISNTKESEDTETQFNIIEENDESHITRQPIPIISHLHQFPTDDKTYTAKLPDQEVIDEAYINQQINEIQQFIPSRRNSETKIKELREQLNEEMHKLSSQQAKLNKESLHASNSAIISRYNKLMLEATHPDLAKLQQELVAKAVNPKTTAAEKSKIREFLEDTLFLAQKSSDLVDEMKANARDKEGLATKTYPKVDAFVKKIQQYENKYIIPQSLGKKIGVIACTVVGTMLGAVIGAAAGLALGALIGGGAGSVVPLFGNIAGAIAGGSVVGVIAAVKGAGIGAAIGAGVAAFLFGSTLGSGAYLSTNFFAENKTFNKPLKAFTAELRNEVITPKVSKK